MRTPATIVLIILFGCHCIAEAPKPLVDAQRGQPAEPISKHMMPSSLRTGGRLRGESTHLGRRSIQTIFPEPHGPTWSDANANPPLSVLDAIKLGIRKRQEIFPDTGAYAWHLAGAKLTPWDAKNGFWYWRISFNYKINDPNEIVERADPSVDLHFIVLMNGEVVEPKVSRRHL